MNDTLVVAGGELYLNDSTGRADPYAYSLAIWDGATWHLRRLVDRRGNLIPEIVSILSFGSKDFWIANGGVYHWDGQSYQVDSAYEDIFLSGGVDSLMRAFRLWGDKRTNIYACGLNGFLSHFDGASWHRIYTGTHIEIHGIWGSTNSTSGEQEVLAVASRIDQNEGKMLFRVQPNYANVLSDSGLSWCLSAIWFAPNSPYYIVGAGIHQRADLYSGPPWTFYPPGEVTSYLSISIHGESKSDLFVAGSFGEIVHYNGSTWRNYIAETGSSGNYYMVRQRGNLVVAVGDDGMNAHVAIGRR